VSTLLRQAEDIVEIATRGNQDLAILIDAAGAIRIIDPTGWSLPALAAESGASAVFKVERRAGALRVEGWDGAQRCLIQRRARGVSPLHQPLQRSLVRFGGEQHFEQPVSRDLDRRLPVQQREADYLAILRHPYPVDQPVLHAVVGVLNGNPHQSVTECEHYTLECAAIAIHDGDHLTPLCSRPGYFG
jgi:hypothetical protein